MKLNNSTLVLFLLLLAAACQPKSTESTPEEAAEEAPVAEAPAPVQPILNANLASEEALIDAGIPEVMVSGILASRPFLNMMDMDAIVRTEMEVKAAEDFYSKVFVPFNLNTTPEEQFKIIPGVGDRMAHEFEEYRPYVSIRQFRKEIGKYVDEAEVARLEQYVFVPVELNTASEEDILALPGVGDRMAHEFLEYRPYENLEQFRREIGKYVDDTELARLERFVYLNEE